MAKREIRKSKGKNYGRSRGPLEWCDKLGRKTTQKMIQAIKNNEN